MNKLSIFILSVIALTICSCGGKDKKNDKFNDTLSTTARAEGDSTLYGLACEGCTDSVLVFLSLNGGDPVTYDIIDAVKHKRIIGQPETGDWVGVIVDPTDKKKAYMVIDLDQLKGKWVYLAEPKLRKMKTTAAIITDEDKAQQDSMIRAAMVPREQGFALKRSSVAEPVGFMSKRGGDDDSPVEYPEMKMYTEWHVYNGKLVLKAGGMNIPGGKKQTAAKVDADTAEFVFMVKDSLRLKFKDEVRSYYRK